MKAIIALRIFTVDHQIYGDSIETIFTDEKSREYDSYEEVKADISKLVDLTKKAVKPGQEFEIYVKISCFVIAQYYSYVSKMNRHLTKGYSQNYKTWEGVLQICERAGINTKSAVIVVNRTKLYKDKLYRLQKFNDFCCKNLGKFFRLKDTISNDWNGEIEGFQIKKDGTILIDCYWQGDSTDGSRLVVFDGGPIIFNTKEMDKYGNYQTHRIKFTLDHINQAILNVLLENCKIQ